MLSRVYKLVMPPVQIWTFVKKKKKKWISSAQEEVRWTGTDIPYDNEQPDSQSRASFRSHMGLSNNAKSPKNVTFWPYNR